LRRNANKKRDFPSGPWPKKREEGFFSTGSNKAPQEKKETSRDTLRMTDMFLPGEEKKPATGKRTDRTKKRSSPFREDMVVRGRRQEKNFPS